jgi:hypothetical protein
VVVPIDVVTVTLWAPTAALEAMTRFAVTVFAFWTVTPVAVTPVPETVTPVAVPRLLPLKVTETVVPRTPVVGLIELSNGP